MANLAIKGHKTRGSEVIALLEMLGGNNAHNLYGDESYAYYTIDSDKEIKGGIYVFDDEQLCYFTLEEFLEKFPYKVGDKVNYVKYNDECPSVYTIQVMWWTGVTINYVLDLSGFSALTKDLQPYKEETMDRKYNVEEYLKIWEETEKGMEVVVNDKFELKEDNGKFYIIKKQPKYPKTYEECCKVLCCKPIVSFAGLDDNEENLYGNFIALKRCRDAYWKIAGEQMGLGKSWEPDWLNVEQDKYVLFTHNNAICSDCYVLGHNILTFPTAEMRNAFYENFKELIETCKELL